MQVELKNGSLDINMNLVIDNYKKENKILFDFMMKVDTFLYNFERELKKTNPKDIDAYIIASFVQIHSSYQSIIILLERGLYDDSQILLRSLFEKIIKCLFVIYDDKNFIYLKQETNKSKISLFEYVIKNKELFDNSFVDSCKNASKSLKNNMMRNKRGKALKKASIKDMCEIIEKKEVYFIYKYLCGYSHNDLFVVANKIIFNKNIVTINHSLEYSDNLNNDISIIINSLGYIIIPLCNYIANDKMKKEFERIIKDFNDKIIS